jgi:hypothetical protein
MLFVNKIFLCLKKINIVHAPLKDLGKPFTSLPSVLNPIIDCPFAFHSSAYFVGWRGFLLTAAWHPNLHSVEGKLNFS